MPSYFTRALDGSKKPKDRTDGMRENPGKRAVALARGGNYAHAGDEEVIKMTFQKLGRLQEKQERSVLDVGCGRGGTAQYILKEKFASEVVGVDIEEKAILDAQQDYPDIKFYVGSATALNNIPALANKKFDVICLFNAFYAFLNQLDALKKFRQLAHDNTILIINDYLELDEESSLIVRQQDKHHHPFIPINQKTLATMLRESEWNDEPYIEDLTVKYQIWYKELIEKLTKKREEIIAANDEAFFEKALNRYNHILKEIEEKRIGGCTVTACSKQKVQLTELGSVEIRI